MQPFIKTIHARGVLSFAPDSEPLPLTPLNVLIGPNGSGKSNLIEIFELLKALPTDLAEAIRDGGGIGEWLWKGGAKVGEGRGQGRGEHQRRPSSPGLRRSPIRAGIRFNGPSPGSPT